MPELTGDRTRTFVCVLISGQGGFLLCSHKKASPNSHLIRPNSVIPGQSLCSLHDKPLHVADQLFAHHDDEELLSELEKAGFRATLWLADTRHLTHGLGSCSLLLGGPRGRSYPCQT